MTNITEDYVSFETAKLLKEKGFDEECGCFYNNVDCGAPGLEVDGQLYYKNSALDDEEYATPTLQMAMKWLREVHHIFIDIDYDPHEFGDKPYFTLITNMGTYDYYKGKHLPVNRATYEEMAEAAIKYCLENLI